MTPTSGAARQNAADAYFGAATAHWSRVYAEEGLEALFYRERMVPRFVASGLGETIAVSVADVHELPHHSGGFQVALALGVLPWLHSPQRALRERGRVLVPGGHAIVSADNRLRLNGLFEPRENPLVAPLRCLWRAGKAIRGTHPPGPRWTPHTPAQVDRWLRAAGLEPDRRTTIGFGPFTFMCRPILPDRLGLRLHNRLDRTAERSATLRRHGWHYLVSAHRVDSA